MPAYLGRPIKTLLTLSVTVVSLTAVSLPPHAGDGGAIAAGILGGTALGFLAGTAAAPATAPAAGLLRACLCGTAPAPAALLVPAARGVERLRLCHPAGALLQLMGGGSRSD